MDKDLFHQGLERIFNKLNNTQKIGKKMTAIINISLKTGVLDSQGKAVHHALDSLNFKGVDDVRVGKQIVMKLSSEDAAEARAEVAEMCEALLANTVIENYEIELIK